MKREASSSDQIVDLNKEAPRHCHLTFPQAMVRGTVTILFSVWKIITAGVCHSGRYDEVALFLSVGSPKFRRNLALLKLSTKSRPPQLVETCPLLA